MQQFFQSVLMEPLMEDVGVLKRRNKLGKVTREKQQFILPPALVFVDHGQYGTKLWKIQRKTVRG